MHQTISITVTGKVQGVFYRQSTKEMAKQLSISGQIRNLSNGNVEIIATGTKDQLNKLVDWCRQGPPRSIVTEISCKELPLQEFTNFTIVRF
jgi:acylphosphatase